MLVLVDPVWLWALLAVGAVAAWALVRPSRRLATVGSLELWREAVEGLDRSRRFGARRVTLAWVLLLLGAAAAVAAAARPAVLSSAPGRRVAIALYPSAEVGQEEGMSALRRSAEAVLDRLGQGDRVQWLLPDAPFAPAPWASVAEARRRLADLRALPMAAGDMSLWPPAREAQHVYRIAPAGSGIPPAAGETLIEVPTALPEVTVDALAAEALPAPGGPPQAEGNVQVFLAARDWTGRRWEGRWRLTAWGGSPEALTRSGRIGPLAAGERGTALATVPAPGYLLAEAMAAEGGAASQAFLARREEARAKVAFAGGDDPLLRRFIRVSRELAPAASAAEADVVVCIGQEPPAGKPALVIRPPSPPPGAREGAPLEDLVLGEAGAAADTQDPVMRDVDLSAVAIRRAQTWRVDPAGGLKTLCGVRGEALIARTTPERTGEADVQKRVYLCFALDTENTNFAASESFVIFLANVFRWLAPRRIGEARYEFLTPREAAFHDDWTAVLPGGPSQPAWGKGPCLPPGVYRDAQGGLHAVSLVGLRSARPGVEPAEAVAAAPLPPPRWTGTSRQLGPWLALAAMALWLAGWAARMR